MNTVNDFIAKRCEEILQSDKKSQALNRNILAIEKGFRKKLSPELQKEYNKLEELIIEANTYNVILIFKKCCSKIFEVLG